MMTLDKSLKRHSEAWTKLVREDAKRYREKGRFIIMSETYQLHMWLETFERKGRTGIKWQFQAFNNLTQRATKVCDQLPQPPDADNIPFKNYIKTVNGLKNARQSWLKK